MEISQADCIIRGSLLLKVKISLLISECPPLINIHEAEMESFGKLCACADIIQNEAKMAAALAICKQSESR